MVYAPVCIPTLNRYEHLKELIESLQQNSWAQYTDLYIGWIFRRVKSTRRDIRRLYSIYAEGSMGFKRFMSLSVI